MHVRHRLHARLPALLSVTVVALACGGAPSGLGAGPYGPAHRSVVPHAQCFLAAPGAAPPTQILAPASGAAFSRTIPLAVAPPSNSTTDSVQVCASYYYRDPYGHLSYQPNRPVATLDGLYSHMWSASWDVSAGMGVASQSGITLTYLAHDQSGVETLIGMVQNLVVDQAPPATSASLLSPPELSTHPYTAPDGTIYVAADTPILFSAVDPPLDDGSAGSGATAYNSIDAGPAVAATGPLILGDRGLADGPHRVTYWGVDGAGNVEAAHGLTVTLDARPPSITPLITGAFNADGSAYTSVQVAFAAADDGSGLADIAYANAPGFAQPYLRGQQIVITRTSLLVYGATDHVGNTVTGTLPITVATPTATPLSLPTSASIGVTTDAPAPTATDTARAAPALPPTPTPTRTPAPTHTPAPTRTPASTATPRPTATWPPLDGPPILRRTPFSMLAAAGGASPLSAEPLHLHALPLPAMPAPPTPRAASRSPRCTGASPCAHGRPRPRSHRAATRRTRRTRRPHLPAS